jgi:diamine N-acetyltransferase
MITIHTATPADAERIAIFGRWVFDMVFSPQNDPANMKTYMDEVFTTAHVIQEFEEPNALFFTATVDDNLVGYAKIRTVEFPPALDGLRHIELQRIYVDPAFHGKNVAVQLLETCIQQAQKQDFEAIWLGVWEHNHRAIRFYERMGFELCSTHEFMLGNEVQIDLVMKKLLV